MDLKLFLQSRIMVKPSSAQVKIPYRGAEFQGQLVYGSKRQLKRKVVSPLSISFECDGIKLTGVDVYRGLELGLNLDFL